MPKKVNIIGAGLAGISTGIYLAQQGFDTEIFELAPWAGGQCTTWVRGGYRFDGCIHWMVGTRKGDPVYKLYREVGALDESTEIYNAPSIRTEINGVMFDIPLEIEKFKALLLKYAKGDEDKINAVIKDIETMMHSKLPMGMPGSAKEAIDMILHSRGFLSLARKYGAKTVKEYLQGIQSDMVRQILLRLMPPEFSAVGLIMMLGTRMSGNAGYPMGGALEVMQRMVNKYKALGGKINFNSRVDEIVVENGAAKGVRVKGKLYPAEYVVAACDAYDTLKNMLSGKYEHPQLDTLLREAPLFDPLAIVSFGLNKRLDIPFAVTFECPEGIEAAPGVRTYSLSLRSFDFDKKAAPVGCSSVMAMLGAPLDWWQSLRETDPEEYKKQKQLLANAVAAAMEKRIPGFKDAICVTDVSTPATYVRLTNVYKGSYEGFAPLPSAMKHTIQKTVPGIKNLYLCGQWTCAGGGICTAVNDGKTVARKIAKELK
jgi:phytoene dehydrogenase-like protein